MWLRAPAAARWAADSRSVVGGAFRCEGVYKVLHYIPDFSALMSAKSVVRYSYTARTDTVYTRRGPEVRGGPRLWCRVRSRRASRGGRWVRVSVRVALGGSVSVTGTSELTVDATRVRDTGSQYV